MNDPSPANPNSSPPPLSQTYPQADDLIATQKLLRATLDSSMDMIQVFEAVRNEQSDIIDFIWVLNNHAAEKIYGDVVGKNLLSLNPGVMDEGIFGTFKRVVETGTPDVSERHYAHEQFDGWFYQSVVKLNDGVATTTADITSRKKAEQQLQQSWASVQSVIDSSLDVIQVFKAVRDETGAILDFVWVMNNQKAVVQNGQVIGKSLLKLNSGVVPTGIFEHMVEVAQTGVAYEHEQYYHHEQFEGWFYQALVKTDDGVAMTTRDISRQKQAEREVLRLKDETAQKATDKYRTLFNSIDEGFEIVELIYNQAGKPIDFLYLETNPAFERQTGLKNVEGKLGKEVSPNIEAYWLEAIDKVVKTGEPIRVDNYNAFTQRWYSSFGFRVGNETNRMFAVLFNDITERKQLEQQRDYLLRLNDALRPLTDPIDIQRVAMKTLGEQLEVDRVVFGAVEGDFVVIHDNYVSEGTQKMLGHIPIAAYGKSVKQLNKGENIIVDDVSLTDYEETEKQTYYAIGIHAFLVIPLVKDGKFVVNLAVSHQKPRHWQAYEIKLAEETAERTWAAVERAKVEEALHASQNRFQSIANLVPDLLWDSGTDGATNWYNDRWLEYTGQTFEEAIGWGWTDAIHPHDREGSVRGYSEAVLAGQPVRLEERIRRYDGAYRWFVVNVSPLKDEQDRVVKMYGAATDIHESKRLEATLLDADQRKDEFLAMLAHELRNPMSTIRSGLQILRLVDAKDELISNTVEMMNRQTDHLARMMDDLLDVSRISRGKIELKPEQVNLVEVVRQAVDSVRSLFREQGKRLQLDLPTAPIYLEGDATRLTQVVANLLTNGFRYTGEQGTVWLSLKHQNGRNAASPTGRQEAILQVRDNGIGIPADQLEAIFELFAQVDNSTARSKGGLGLGLTLVKRLVEMHGGRVEAQSGGIGKGSIFRVHLPTLTAADSLPPTLTASAGESAKAGRILVIDDNADATLMMTMLLKLKGYETHSQNSGRAGIEAAERLQPGAILLDIGMPELDGYETCRLIREQSWGQAMVVIALTGYGQEEDRQRSREAGFDGHLVKPVDVGALIKLLTDLLNKDQNRAGLT